MKLSNQANRKQQAKNQSAVDGDSNPSKPQGRRGKPQTSTRKGVAKVDTDRNFDDLAQRFKRNIYGTLKGKIRLSVLQRDFAAHIPELRLQATDGLTNETSIANPLSVLDAGAGQAQFSMTLAERGCELVINDISTEMLKLAMENITDQGADTVDLLDRVQILQCPIQDLQNQLLRNHHHQQFDIIICHAVIEWLANPQGLFDHLMPLLKPGGYLSLTFYNINGLAFKNLLRTNYHKFDIDNFTAFPGSLTPTHPQDPQQVLRWMEQHKLEVLCKSGIRVFHDFIMSPEDRNREPEALVEKELDYSQREPFWQMARYIHFLAKAGK